LKQVQRWDQSSLATLQLEAHCYRLTHENKEFDSLRALVPRFHFYDAGRAVLVTELLGGGESLAEYYSRNNRFPNEVATQLGRAFGSYHRVIKNSNSSETTPLFPRRVPWVFSFHQMNPPALQDVSAGSIQMLNILKRHPDFARVLDKLAAEWKFESLIHGDIKWDNCVLVPDAKHQTVQLKLVDWELADWGDPCWDVAAIFSAFIVFWIQSLPLSPGSSVEQAMSQSQYPIEKMQPAIRSFWSAYTKEMQLEGLAQQEVLRRSVLFCGARTIQTAYEFVQASAQMNQLTCLILQASLNILTQAEEASKELLGLTIQ
jgi:hypothetical protein